MSSLIAGNFISQDDSNSLTRRITAVEYASALDGQRRNIKNQKLMRQALQFSRYWQTLRPRIVATAGLLALALMQVSIASHQFEHLAGDITDVCLACAQFERLDDVVVESASDPLPAVSHAAPRAEFPEPAEFRQSSLYAIRAPPLA